MGGKGTSVQGIRGGAVWAGEVGYVRGGEWMVGKDRRWEGKVWEGGEGTVR